MIEELELKTKLVCGQLNFHSGEMVTAYKVSEATYKVFLSNGWWAVDEGYFKSTLLMEGEI